MAAHSINAFAVPTHKRKPLDSPSPVVTSTGLMNEVEQSPLRQFISLGLGGVDDDNFSFIVLDRRAFVIWRGYRLMTL